MSTETAGQAQVGVMGLAVMGSNLARNFASRGHTVALFNRTQARTDHLMQTHGDEGSFLPASSIEQFVASLERPRRDHHHGQGGRPHRRGDRRAGPAASRPGDIVVDGGNAHFAGHPPPRGGPAPSRACTSSVRRLRRRGGRAARARHHAGRLTRVVRRPRADAGEDLRQGRRRALLRLHGPRRRRPLRQDGAQRHRVRRHAAHRRGLRPAPRRRAGHRPADRRRLRRVEQGRAGLVPHRDHRRGPAPGRRRDRRSRWSTSSSTRPSRRAPAAGPCRTRSSWACRSPPSPSRCSPGPPPGTSTCAPRPPAPSPARTTARCSDVDQLVDDVRGGAVRPPRWWPTPRAWT